LLTRRRILLQLRGMLLPFDIWAKSSFTNISLPATVLVPGGLQMSGIRAVVEGDQ
jgi:hypothetical protein